MALTTKVSDDTLLEITKIYEGQPITNLQLADRYKQHGVTEKNIRDWAKRFGWRRYRDPQEKEKIAKKMAIHKIVEEEEAIKDIIPHLGEQELAKMVAYFVQMILDGYSKHKIFGFAKDKWALSKTEALKIHIRAYEAIGDSIEKNVKSTLAFHKEARLMLYNRALGDKDLKTAHAILMDMGKLDGIYPDKPLIQFNQFKKETKVINVRLPEREVQNG